MENDHPPADGDETTLIAWFAHHSGRAHETLARRLIVVADLVVAFGHDACREELDEAKRLQRITCELSALTFAHLE
jgi:hypothetical protein